MKRPNLHSQHCERNLLGLSTSSFADCSSLSGDSCPCSLTGGSSLGFLPETSPVCIRLLLLLAMKQFGPGSSVDLLIPTTESSVLACLRVARLISSFLSCTSSCSSWLACLRVIRKLLSPSTSSISVSTWSPFLAVVRVIRMLSRSSSSISLSPCLNFLACLQVAPMPSSSSSSSSSYSNDSNSCSQHFRLICPRVARMLSPFLSPSISVSSCSPVLACSGMKLMPFSEALPSISVSFCSRILDVSPVVRMDSPSSSSSVSIASSSCLLACSHIWWMLASFFSTSIMATSGPDCIASSSSSITITSGPGCIVPPRTLWKAE
mmetsp:Transcript_18260/g.28351  ORF Transcript_18260/g.28351 Transcript_18260/m.28351 type:complete len:321 (-) Transcript_18260:172-1134(-)